MCHNNINSVFTLLRLFHAYTVLSFNMPKIHSILIKVFSLIFLSITLLFSFSASAKSLALSFDDGLNPQTNPNAPRINQEILTQLKYHKIHSIIFPSLIKIGDFQGKQLIKDWGLAGHIIGNHSALHQNLNKDDVSLDSYLNSIQNADLVFKNLPNYQRIYRYPFLKEGNSVVKRDKVHQWLQQHHYQIGAVSIDASDWFYNRKYLEYLHQQSPEKIQRLKLAYIDHLLNRAEYYDQLAQQVIQRSPAHILLLHTNQINAAFLNSIILAFQDKGWSFISAQDALKDPLYLQRSQNIPAGESILWSIAKTQGITSLRYPAEDAPYELENLNRHQLD